MLPQGTGRLENPAFININSAVGLVNRATRWQNPTLDREVGDRRGMMAEKNENFLLLPLYWKGSCFP